MGHVLYGNATTTAGVRRAIQNSQDSIRTLAKQHSINSKIVAKWKERDRVHDADMGPNQRHSTILTAMKKYSLPLFGNSLCFYWMTASMLYKKPSPI